ncbi:RING-H2 finger protein ATL33 [Trifolium repens]|nr:RING-H2 finger protein ATL33 [Trifolium repens]
MVLFCLFLLLGAVHGNQGSDNEGSDDQSSNAQGNDNEGSDDNDQGNDNEGSDDNDQGSDHDEHNNALANHNQQNSRPNGFHEERAIQSTNKEITRSAIIRLLPPVKSFLDDENNKDYCPICLDVFKKGALIQPFRVCNHEFHVSCLFLWLHDQGKTTCPVCRQDL